ncbi:ring-cleaving dioxygenase [Methylobacterium oryzisoli]|uniref:ring-cleaving dioxygenase n=1 Tax=Methylobacterium oryzisoli TaxID=3385502 RepID=UPI003892C50A
MQLTGIHHLTAVTARAADNLAFYTRVLGLRLVKKTVNQDDVSAYHLFYADGLASPGSDLTFFDWPAAPERRGTNSIARTMLRVSGPETIAWWREHLARQGVAHRPPVARDGRLTLDFEDPEGQRLSLVDDGGAGPSHPWAKSPVPEARQIRGLGPILISVAAPRLTETVLTGVLGLRPVRTYAAGDAAAASSAERPVQVYTMGEGGPAAELHVVAEPELGPARQGAGGVHHVAFRIPDDAYEGWSERLRSLRVPSSGPVDRYYFRSLYFREPNGILFEIATDGPGFATDEPLEQLGERLALPPFLEPRRAEIEAGLAPL